MTVPPSSAAGPAGLLIRRAVVDDARVIAEINFASWRAAYQGILPDDFLAGMPIGPREIALRSRLEMDQQTGAPAWLAERDGIAVGFVSTGPPRDEDVPLPAAEVYAIYVLPESWRRGAGTALLTMAVDHWTELGVTSFVLWVLEANTPARAFYESLGWRPDGTRQEVDLGGFTATEVRYRRQP